MNNYSGLIEEYRNALAEFKQKLPESKLPRIGGLEEYTGEEPPTVLELEEKILSTFVMYNHACDVLRHQEQHTGEEIRRKKNVVNNTNMILERVGPEGIKLLKRFKKVKSTQDINIKLLKQKELRALNKMASLVFPLFGTCCFTRDYKQFDTLIALLDTGVEGDIHNVSI